MHELSLSATALDYEKKHKSYTSLVYNESELVRHANSLSANYLKIGAILARIKRDYLYFACERINGERVLSFEDYARLRWGLSKTSISVMVGINEYFCDKDGVPLPEFQSYGYSQLCDLLPLVEGGAYVDGRYVPKFPAWVKEEINPQMTVAEIREKKKEHKAKKKAVDQIKTLPPSETLAELKAPVTVVNSDVGTETVVKEVSGEDVPMLVFKNDDSRRYFLQNYWAWSKYHYDPFLKLSYYRALMNDGTWIIAIAWGNGRDFSYSRMYYLRRPGKNFCLFAEVVGTLVTFMRSEKLSLVLDSVKKEWRDKIGEKLERPIEE